ncbi:MAG: transglycosylase SLT domain-containing protein [Longimicrobiales bacterium]
MISRSLLQKSLVGLTLVATACLGGWSVSRDEPRAEREVADDVAFAGLNLGGAGEWEPSKTWDITKTRNAAVEKWIDFLRGRNRDRTRLWLERQGRYGPLIRSALRSRGMPEDLFYLAFIESGLSPAATSHASAVGIWQFIAETGRRYGLTITSELDERRDPMRSTEAALSYLQDNYDRFGSWYLAAAAYNTGENRVGRIMRQRFGTERGKDSHFWQIDSRLPRETRDYVPLMLAAAHIAKDPEANGFHGLRYQAPLAYDQVAVPGPTSLEAVAEAAAVPADAVRDLNPHLVQGWTPSGTGWWVRIPSGTEQRFAQRIGSVYRAEQSKTRYHVVRRGDNLTVIARRYNTSIRQLQQWNGLSNRNLIQVGQRLRVGR